MADDDDNDDDINSFASSGQPARASCYSDLSKCMGMC